MTIELSAAKILARHVTCTLECKDQLYLNTNVPLLQTGAGAAWFFCEAGGYLQTS